MKNCFMNFSLSCILLQLSTVPACAGDRSINLSGTWRFEADPQAVGMEEAWFSRPIRDTILLPGITDTAGVGGPEKDRNPGYLSRLHKYIGPAWYQCEITIPSRWRGDDIDLFLERVMWESRSWIDGKPCGVQDSLGMLDAYGNHPSFCLFAIGNELGSSDFEVMGEWIFWMKYWSWKHGPRPART